MEKKLERRQTRPVVGRTAGIPEKKMMRLYQKNGSETGVINI